MNKFKKFLFFIFFLLSAFLIDVKLYRLKLYAIQIGIVVFLVLWSIEVLTGKIKEIKLTKIDFLFFLYIFYIFLKFLFSDEKIVAHDELLRNLLLFSCFFVGKFYRNFRKEIINYWLLFGFFVALYGIWQNFGGKVLFFEVPKISPPFATFGNRNFFAGYLILLFPISFGLFLETKKFFKVIQTFVFAFAIFLTKSRAGILGAIFSIFVIFYLKTFKKFSFNKKILISTIFSLLVIFSVFKFKDFFLRQKTRLLIWRDTLKMTILKNPFFGVGIGEFRIHFPEYAGSDLKKVYPQNKFIVNFAHNEYLEIFSEQGIIGLFLFLTIIFLSLKTPIKYYLKASLFSSLFQAFFSVSFRFSVISSFFFLLLGLSLEEKEEKVFNFDIIKKTILSFLVIVISLFMVKEVVFSLKAREGVLKEKDFFENKKDNSLNELEKKFEKKPSYKLSYELGWKFAKVKNWEKAIFYFKKAIEFNPTSFGAYNNLGNIYFHLNNLAQAIKFWEASLKIKPDQIDARFNLGYAYYLRGNLKESTKHLKKVLELDPDNSKAKIVLEKMYQ